MTHSATTPAHSHPEAMPYQAALSPGLTGTVAVPGDKSISHRCLMLGALATGTSQFTGLLEGEDVLATAAALRACGVTIDRLGDGHWQVQGVGLDGLQEPATVLDLGNSGTSTRLLLGLLAGCPFGMTFTGDASLRSRPMERVLTPLRRMGASFMGRSKDRLPLTMHGHQPLRAIHYKLPVASAQVKSAILLAGLRAEGTTVVVEPEPTRDHTERMLTAMGAELRQERTHEGVCWSIDAPQNPLKPLNLAVPGDPSSAAFLLGAAAVVKGSQLTVTGVGMNPLRTGFITTLQEMGADLTLLNQRDQGGELVADILVRYSPNLTAVDVPANRAPSMIDEYLIAAVVAAFANGTSVFRGLAELRAKETDRLRAAADGLSLCGVDVRIDGDDLYVTGGNGSVAGGATLNAQLDHRVAMSFLVLGLASQQPVVIDDVSAILTSFPNFIPLLQSVGAKLRAVS
jgi:3-phosphoshikimate 1-carboxyvinyltransferase